MEIMATGDEEPQAMMSMMIASILDVVKRYRSVLKHVQRDFRMTTAFKKAHVSKNAVKDTAAIAEIYVADKSLLDQFKGKYTLLKLAQLCQKKKK
ncbi:Coiled-coil domain-containing protein 106 [Labeo rohita]|uniref:Coiled-coil domain-containing protein 106 n=1 Tax=Labeo rohita TaxID=84645 RepID=A0ABQ8LKJ7_LABRO|nr:Coiled-coil domain-containing protein 106 [Labeo rohita]